MVSASKVATVTGVSVLTGFLLYAVYFDHKRRHDPAFRSRLRKDAKRSQKEVKRQALQKEKEADQYCEKVVKALNSGNSIIMPDEETFSQQVQLGEALSGQGPDYYLPAASAFFKALKFYPSPAELLMIYQKAVPEQCLKYVEKMISLDPQLSNASSRQQMFANVTRGAAGASRLEEIDDEVDESKTPIAKSTNESNSGSNSGTNTLEEGAPSVSSQEWEKVSQTTGEESEQQQKVEQSTTAPATNTTTSVAEGFSVPPSDLNPPSA